MHKKKENLKLTCKTSS